MRRRLVRVSPQGSGRSGVDHMSGEPASLSWVVYLIDSLAVYCEPAGVRVDPVFFLTRIVESI